MSGKVRRIIFKEIKSGDLKKFTATAAPSGTGGGARDLRFSPFKSFDGVFGLALTGRKTVTRKRLKQQAQIEIYTAEANVFDSGGKASKKTISFEPPTTARGTEGRLACVHKLNLHVPQGEGRLLFLIVQDSSDMLIVTFATEASVQKGEWQKDVNDFFARVFGRPERHQATQGFIDFERHTSFIK